MLTGPGRVMEWYVCKTVILENEEGVSLDRETSGAVLLIHRKQQRRRLTMRGGGILSKRNTGLKEFAFEVPYENRSGNCKE